MSTQCSRFEGGGVTLVCREDPGTLEAIYGKSSEGVWRGKGGERKESAVHHAEIMTVSADFQGKLHQSNLHVGVAHWRSLTGHLALQTIRASMATPTLSIKARKCQDPSTGLAWVHLHDEI
ncbi:hypothetical protein E2C01_035317 [Portunus trituberculatus]|uniref:Uncharacterized protein n=1 Tax=Portunus trituberculatus TaxID=210409 RepID=A0A5B7F8W2_PORTR|nr:hypothetical protein [Portunus trituberculatus]